MHELSLAHNLVEIAGDAARQANIHKVNAVHLKLGALAGVVTDSLLFCYDLAAQGTPLEGSRLIIEHVPLVVKCELCDTGCELPEYNGLICPRHGLPAPLVVQGRELRIESLEYDE
jgi:hydrogenase nickel incorporation protein HypA/HybF